MHPHAIYIHTYIHKRSSAIRKSVFHSPTCFRIQYTIKHTINPHKAITAISSRENGIHETSQDNAADIKGYTAVEYHSPIDAENLADRTKTTRIESTICLTLIFNLLAELIEDDVAEADEQAHEAEKQEEWPGHYI